MFEYYQFYSMRYLLPILFACSFIISYSQKPTKAVDRWEGYDKRKSLEQNSLVKNIEFKNIGPTVMSGRVTDIEVNPKNNHHFYVAYASGGLWETKNNGTSFTPIFDHEIVMSIGDFAVDWDANILYVGTGENNSSRSSYSGVGIFKSTDNGKNWEHLGLDESHHIGKIIIHPSDIKTIFVAALGHLYSPNEERGIYKSKDAGQTWEKVLFVNENCGGIDLVMNENNPNTIYASMWERTRRAWDFTEGGTGSGIYKSTDSGDSWTRVTGGESGFPSNQNTGRIGLSLYANSSSEVLYAILDNQDRRPQEDEEIEEGLTKEQFKTMSKETFLSIDKEQLESYLRDNNFPEKYEAKGVIKMVKKGEIIPVDLANYLENANAQLFDTPVIGAELYKSIDGGITWEKTHEDFLDDVVYSYGYYFGLVRVNPLDANDVYIAGVPILRSTDGGKTFDNINGDNVHVDHHSLWISPTLPGHLINGNDGGINISYDHGEHWYKCNSPAVGQFYTIQIDNDEPYNVYGGLQDNGVWVGSHTYEYSDNWHSSGRYPYDWIMGGDGMQIMVDNRNPDLVYTGYQFGNYYRIDRQSEKRSYITPRHNLGERPYRFNWQTPIWLSKHNQDILYMGSERVHRSMNRGETWESISKDLTKGGKKGDVPYGTLTSIHESPLQFGLLYAGSDDGRIHVSKDGGNKWTEITGRLPSNMWVSRVKASVHQKDRVYLTLNGYRWDDFNAYVYISNDYGSSWKMIGTDLPAEPVNVIYEDPENENILYIGTDHGLYCSLDRGETFMVLGADIPNVAVHDLAVHNKEKHLLVGTHGRSFYLGDISNLQLMVDSVMESSLFVFDIPEMMHRSNWGNNASVWSDEVIPETSINVYSNNESKVKLIVALEETVLYEDNFKLEKGLNFLTYHLEINEEVIDLYQELLNEELEDKIELEPAENGKFYLKPGTYQVTIKKDEDIVTKDLTLMEK